MFLVDGPTDKWDLGTWLKSVGTLTLAILGRELIKRWKKTAKEKSEFEEKLIKELMLRNAELSARIDSSQAEHIHAMLKLQDLYDQRVKMHRDRAHALTQKLTAAYLEMALKGLSTQKIEALGEDKNFQENGDAQR